MASRPPDDDKTARARWMTIQAVRIGGAVLALVGLLMISGRIDAPALVGYALFAMGMVEFFVVPTVLARKWRTPGP